MAEGSHQRDIISGANAKEGTRDKEFRKNMIENPCDLFFR